MIFNSAEVLSSIITVQIQSFDEAFKINPRQSRTRYFFHEGATLPYLNGTVREKFDIVWYFTLNRIGYDTEHYRKVPDTLPNSTGQFRTCYRTVLYSTAPTNQTNWDSETVMMMEDGSKAKQARFNKTKE